MQFCPKCGGLLYPFGDKKKRMTCSCGYKARGKRASVILKEKVKDNKRIEVIDKKVETLPKTDADCKKCGNKKAYYWLVQTRAADEAETRFFECTKCGYRWREYS